VVKNTEGNLIYKEKLQELKFECKSVDKAFDHFLKIQTETGFDSGAHKESKKIFSAQLKELEEKLNRYLADTYGLGAQTQWKSKKEKEDAYQSWKESHQPFHWLAEFYGIISKGGFDVVIGNPPYVEYNAKLKNVYTIKNYSTIECGNLHSFIAEQVLRNLSNRNGLIGLIVPLPSINTARMASLQKIIKPSNNNNRVWISSFDERPSNLFTGVDQRLIIEIVRKNAVSQLFTTGINRWKADNRDLLFSLLAYSEQNKAEMGYTLSILKIKNDIEASILTKFYKHYELLKYRSDIKTGNCIYYRTAGGRYWKVVLSKPAGTETLSEKSAHLNGLTCYQAISIISSSLFWWRYSSHFDMFNLKDYMIFGFRIGGLNNETASILNSIGKKYEESLENNAIVKRINSKSRGTVEQKQYLARLSKPIIDEIDKALAMHYGFTEEELDFIINYDIKYRMGGELEGEEK
jgi:hypothetical protein